MWDKITYLFPNFNGATVEVWEWISNFITLYRACNYLSMQKLKLNYVIKRDECQYKVIIRYWKYHCGDEKGIRLSCLHIVVSYTVKVTSLYWNRLWVLISKSILCVALPNFIFLFMQSDIWILMSAKALLYSQAFPIYIIPHPSSSDSVIVVL